MRFPSFFCLFYSVPDGKHISSRNLYQIYSHNDKKRTFIDYAKKARHVMGLHDPETDAVIKRHKQKIAQAVKAGIVSEKHLVKEVDGDGK